MNRTAIVAALAISAAIGSVVFLSTGRGRVPVVDGSSAEAFRTSLELVKQSLDKERYEEFERAMTAHARAALLPGGDGESELGALVALQADPDAPARRLRGRLDGMTAAQIVGAADSPAVVGLMGARKQANESAAIATLKNITSSQAQAQASGFIDRDGDGVGEYAYFAELAGVAEISATGTGPSRITPPVLSSAFGNVEGGRVMRSGYVFQVFLPGPAASFEAEAPDGGTVPGRTDADQSEVLWCCYAWPTDVGNSGDRAFFVHQSGDVLASRNAATRYSGTLRVPRPTAAFTAAASTMADRTAADTTGSDGEVWAVVH